MRTLFFSLFLVIASCSHPVMATDVSACYAIQDADARAYCRAKAQGNSSTCYTIQSADLRSMCLAEVRK